MYISTRNNYQKVSAATAIKLGMVPEGGLFVPEEIPQLPFQKLKDLKGAPYQKIAKTVLSLYLDDYSQEEIKSCVEKAYNIQNFKHQDVAPLREINKNAFILELWHGPTAAFKDMALQIMPYLLSLAIKKKEAKKETVILVATSGDTGKAALEGFKDVPGIKIIVFYPEQGVSKIQELQMKTTGGNNTYVVAVEGNFDDCQSAVKEIFGDGPITSRLDAHGYELSSANSINWGRLLPQIVYYFAAYLKLWNDKEIEEGEKINFVVPTGNFGNILAAWYAYKMGLPINKLICASNENKVLTDFFKTGTYDRNREFKQTMSPSMDILISSNLERFLYEINGHDGEKIAEWMKQLNTTGKFAIEFEVKEDITEILAADYAEEEETLSTIKEVFEKIGYTLDTHTAVGVKVYNKYVQKTQDQTKTVIDSTASPFKFNSSVLQALQGHTTLQGKKEFDVLKELSNISGNPIHPALQDLDKQPIRHTRSCNKKAIRQEIEDILQL